MKNLFLHICYILLTILVWEILRDIAKCFRPESQSRNEFDPDKYGVGFKVVPRRFAAILPHTRFYNRKDAESLASMNGGKVKCFYYRKT